MSKPAYEPVERPANVYQLEPRRKSARMNLVLAWIATALLGVALVLTILDGQLTLINVSAIGTNGFAALLNFWLARR